MLSKTEKAAGGGLFKEPIGAITVSCVLALALALSLCPLSRSTAIADEGSSFTTGSGVVSQEGVVAQTGGVEYASLPEAVERAEDGATIDILSDTELDKVLLLGKSVTINGNGHALKGSDTRVIRITAGNLNIVLNDWSIISTCAASSDVRGISFDGASSGTSLLMDKCMVSASFYAINVICGPSNLNVTIKNGTVAAGWAGINSYANNSNFIIEDSEIRGINDKGESSWNNFNTITFDGNALWDAGNIGKYGSGNVLELKNSTVESSTASSNSQKWLGVQYGASNNVVTVDADSRLVDGQGNDCSGNFLLGWYANYSSGSWTYYSGNNQVTIWESSEVAANDSFALCTGFTLDSNSDEQPFDVALPTTTPSRPDWIFQGWLDDGDEDSATVYAPGATYTMSAGYGFATFSAQWRRDIGSGDITASPSGQVTYDGTAHPMMLVDNGYVLVAGTDYEMAYSSGDGTNAGEVVATVTGKGDRYSGTRTVRYRIAKAAISPRVSITGWRAGEKAGQPVLAQGSNPGGGSVTYEYKPKGAADSSYSKAAPTVAGAYTLRAIVAETSNYLGGTATVDFQVAAASPVASKPVGSGTSAATEAKPVAAEVVVDSGAPATEASNLDEVAQSVLTDGEKAAARSGVSVDVWLEVSALDGSSVPQADAAVVESALPGINANAKVGAYVDLSLFKKVGSSEKSAIHQTNVPLKFKLVVPEALRSKSSSIVRTFYLIRVHDGQAATLATTTGTTLSGESTLFSSYAIAYSDAKAAKSTAIFRLYNPNSGEHLYTTDKVERAFLIKHGWTNEGVGWRAPVKSAKPVYRLYSGTDHFYTLSKKERDSLVKRGWKYEGISFYSDDQKGVALYRAYNPNVNPKAKKNNSGSHNYTASRKEQRTLARIGWRDEGVAWYGVAS